NELPSIEEFEKMAGELADVDVETPGEGGLTTSEAERSLNEDDDEEQEDAEAVEGEAVDPVVEPGGPAPEEPAADEPVMEEQKAGEA
ncbi:MAG: hypothetical protein QOK38_2355, partial [Acidobacteriaceae bacterium]|nr:hypothetical protein [Acidobacteriaceae bacterium]